MTRRGWLSKMTAGIAALVGWKVAEPTVLRWAAYTSQEAALKGDWVTVREYHSRKWLAGDGTKGGSDYVTYRQIADGPWERVK